MLARKLGPYLQAFYDISPKASGQSWSMTTYCPAPGGDHANQAARVHVSGAITGHAQRSTQAAISRRARRMVFKISGPGGRRRVAA